MYEVRRVGEKFWACLKCGRLLNDGEDSCIMCVTRMMDYYGGCLRASNARVAELERVLRLVIANEEGAASVGYAHGHTVFVLKESAEAARMALEGRTCDTKLDTDS